MKSLTCAIILLTFTAVAPSVLAQSTGGAAVKRSQVVVGEVELAGAQIQIVLTNTSDKRAFQGVAKVSIGLSADAAIELAIKLDPNETRRFPLPASNASDKSGAEYSLAVYNQTGELVLFKIAPFKTIAGGEREPALRQAPSPPGKSSEELKVTAQLTRGLANRDAEIPTTDQAEPFTLTFEIESNNPVKDATFTISAKDFQRRQQVTIDGQAYLEFKLPETLSERKLNYTLTSATGQTLVSGEVDLDQLASSDSVSVSSLTFDRQSYAPGESARVVIELLGDGSRGYRLELAVKDGGGNSLLKDERRGSNNDGKSSQEFSIEIPREAQGPIVIDYRVFGAKTGTMSDSGSREIALKDAREDKTGGARRIAP
ncbi:MAG: hypothetical protein J2P52_10030 [Blastocatellia bacterium]|nr:hypothetical protein [Blastocatellia bacterium]